MSFTPYKFNLPSDLQISDLDGATEKNHIATTWEISKTFMFGRNNTPPDVVFSSDVSISERKKLSFNVEEVLDARREYWVHAKYHTNLEAPNAKKIECVLIVRANSTTVNLLGYQDPVTGDVLTYGRELIFDIEPGMRIDYLKTLQGFQGGAAFDDDVLVRSVNLAERTFTVTKPPKHSGKFVFTLTECLSTEWSEELKFSTTLGTWAVLSFDVGSGPNDVTIQATNSHTFSVSASITDGSVISYQWQLRNNFGTFIDIAGETGTSLTFSNVSYINDDGKVVRCKVVSIFNQEIISNEATLTVTPANITIVVSPNDVTATTGATATFNVTATLDTSGTLVYQWQKRELNEQIFNDITGANSASYTTGTLDTSFDGGDSYRCKVSNINALTVFSDIAILISYDYDMYVSPAITSSLTGGSINNWIFSLHGAIIIDGTSAANYTLIPYSDQSRRIWMWGEGRDSVRGGYATGSYNFTANQNYLAQIATGSGDHGDGSGWPSNSRGGGYAGLFTGTSAEQSGALLIAGGAGGAGFGSGTSLGGTGGGSTGGGGTSSSDTEIGSTGGGGASQSSGGSGGTAPGSAAPTTFSQTYNSSTTITIPAGATSVNYTIHGGKGGQGGPASTRVNTSGAVGARGQKISGILNNVEEQSLTLTIGNPGGAGGGNSGGSAGTGYVNGGAGGNDGSTPDPGFDAGAGGGGGGATAISISSTLIALAGGGGGGGCICFTAFAIEEGRTSNVINSTGTATNGSVGGTSGASFNGGGGGGGGGVPGGDGGRAWASGNDTSGEGGEGGEGYYDSTYHVSAPNIQGSTSNSGFITIDYQVRGAAGNDGSALRGGIGGNGETNGFPNAGGGGGGGGGYYGGGGGGGGNDNGNTTRNASGGGGGSGYVHSSIVSGLTGTSSANQDDLQGSGGEPNSRIVIESSIEGPYTAQAGINEYPVSMSNRPLYGWYTRSGGTQTTPRSGVRQLVIIWNGTVVYDQSNPTFPSDGTITVGGYRYIAGTYRSPSAYGWASNGSSSGTQSPPSGDMCNSFDISREG